MRLLNFDWKSRPCFTGRRRLSTAGLALAAVCCLVSLRAAAQPLELPVESPKSKIKNPETESTLVVYNNADPVSVDLAGYYAEKRGIPFDHLIGLDCPLTEEISRGDYDRTIAEPLRKTLIGRGWWRVDLSGTRTLIVENKIRFVALMRGMPLKIAPVASYPGDVQNGNPIISAKNEASVDSELACLGFFSRWISGALENPYYHSYTPMLDLETPAFMLVCRLDAPDAATVRRMIDDAVATERHGLWGFACIDGRGNMDGPLEEGEKWLRNCAENLQRHGVPVVYDHTPGLFPDAYPMMHTALYYGWYAENASGPFARENFQFTPGDVACHIHSFSAASLRDPHKYWVAPLLVHGAAAVLGNVYEPFLGFTPNLDVFDERLRNGFTFAESAYMSQRVLSWMTTFVGDPLYRPFNIAVEFSGSTVAADAEWQAYRRGALTWFEKDHFAGANQLRKSGEALHSGMIFEGLGLLQESGGDPGGADLSFQRAQKFYTSNGDILRIMIHKIGFLRAAGKKDAALKLARTGIKAYPAAPATAVLRAIETELAPPPSPSPSVQKSGNGTR